MRRQSLRQVTSRLITLARKYDNQLPYYLFKDFGDTSNEARRKYDVLIVLKAANLVERRGYILHFHPILGESQSPYQELLMEPYVDPIGLDPVFEIENLCEYQPDTGALMDDFVNNII